MKVGGFEFKRRKLTSARPFGEQPRVCKGERLEAQAAKGVFGRVYACRICKLWFCGRKKSGKKSDSQYRKCRTGTKYSSLSSLTTL